MCPIDMFVLPHKAINNVTKMGRVEIEMTKSKMEPGLEVGGD